jgi:hypothetical protein
MWPIACRQGRDPGFALARRCHPPYAHILTTRARAPSLGLCAFVCWDVQLRFENATAAYMASLEDKGLFGTAKQSASTATRAAGGGQTVPVWVQLQATDFGWHTASLREHRLMSPTNQGGGPRSPSTARQVGAAPYGRGGGCMCGLCHPQLACGV